MHLDVTVVNEIVSIHELKPFVGVVCDEFVNSS